MTSTVRAATEKCDTILAANYAELNRRLEIEAHPFIDDLLESDERAKAERDAAYTAAAADDAPSPADSDDDADYGQWR